MKGILLAIIAQVIPWYLFPGSAQEASVDIPDTVNVSLLLPLDASTEAGGSMFDFYSGALMAARDLGREGIRLSLKVYDVTKTGPESVSLAGSDIIIGPVSKSDMMRFLPFCPDGGHLISPLDPGNAALADSLAVIQVPTPADTLHSDLERWMKEECGPTDRCVVIRPPFAFGEIEGMCAADSVTRFIVDSQDERFLSEAVRNVSVLSMLKYDVALYAPSRIRSFRNLNVELMHEASTRISTSYHIDYSDERVIRFVYAYRALFDAEPDSFAFQGYDILTYFTHICSKFGRDWFRNLPEYVESGLQTDFNFEILNSAGAVNNASRRVVYNKDFSVTRK